MTSAIDRTKSRRPGKQHKSGGAWDVSDHGFNPWQSIPRPTILAFLGAVFFVFTSVGFASDIIGMGREPIPRFEIGVVASGVFAIFYAASGIALRRRFWLALPPIFALQFLVSWLVGNAYPDKPQGPSMDAAAMKELSSRLSLDATAIIFAVSLGYTGFAYVSMSEGRRYARARMEMAVFESEMAAAGEIQQLMLPEQSETLPGFVVESVYIRRRGRLAATSFRYCRRAAACCLSSGMLPARALRRRCWSR